MAVDEQMRDTAKALVFISGMNFDGEAFEESGLSEEEVQELIDEIITFCKSGIKRIQKKYNVEIPFTSSHDVIDAMLFE